MFKVNYGSHIAWQMFEPYSLVLTRRIMVVRVSVDDSEDNYHKGCQNNSPVQDYNYPDDHIQYTYSAKVVT